MDEKEQKKIKPYFTMTTDLMLQMGVGTVLTLMFIWIIFLIFDEKGGNKTSDHEDAGDAEYDEIITYE